MRVSVVIPVYQSARTMPELARRLKAVLADCEGGYEIICIDDHSPDDSWKAIEAWSQEDPNVRGIRLRRNAGQHNAILCGLTHASGDVVITMDDDLQNPPEEIPKLVQALERGFDVAIGAYESKQHAVVRNVSGGLVDRVQRMMFGLPRSFQLTSFRAIRGDVARAVAVQTSTFPYITSMILAHAGSYVNVPVRHDPRQHGSSNYGLVKSLRLASNLLMAYSVIPLLVAAVACAGVLLASALFAGWVLIRALVEGGTPPGWASTVLITTGLTTLNLGVLLLLLLYVSRMYRQVMRSQVPFSVERMIES